MNSSGIQTGRLVCYDLYLVQYPLDDGSTTDSLQETLKRDEQLEKKRRDFVESGGATEDSAAGGIKLGILADLNDMNVDLSASLRKKPAAQEEGSLSGGPSASSRTSSAPIPVRRPLRQQTALADAPLSRLNAEKLKRQNRGNSRPPTIAVASSRTEDEVEKERLIKLERERYEALKRDFQTWTLALIVVGGVATYTSYSRDTSASYLVGESGMALQLAGKSFHLVATRFCPSP